MIVLWFCPLKMKREGFSGQSSRMPWALRTILAICSGTSHHGTDPSSLDGQHWALDQTCAQNHDSSQSPWSAPFPFHESRSSRTAPWNVWGVERNNPKCHYHPPLCSCQSSPAWRSLYGQLAWSRQEDHTQHLLRPFGFESSWRGAVPAAFGFPAAISSNLLGSAQGMTCGELAWSKQTNRCVYRTSNQTGPSSVWVLTERMNNQMLQNWHQKETCRNGTGLRSIQHATNDLSCYIQSLLYPTNRMGIPSAWI
mmetsp:Transcript_46764/g.89312  ORF Transcript_46764/g.89312 Transcript_46764/m.89312 type:complete len:253 (+) Transcript_46764:791-1549(+)